MGKILKLISYSFRYVKDFKYSVVLLLITTIFSVITQLMSPYFLGKTVDLIAGKSLENIVKLMGIIIGLFLLNTIFSILETYLTVHIETKTLVKVRQRLYQRIMDAKIKDINKVDSGEIINKIIGDGQVVASFFVRNITELLVDLLKVFGSMILIFSISIKLSIVAVFLFPLSMILMFIFGKKIKVQEDRRRTVLDKYFSFIQESVRGLKEIKNLCSKEYFISKFNDYTKESTDISIKSSIIIVTSNIINSFTSMGLNIILTILAVLFIISGELTLGSYIAFTSYLGFFMNSTQKVAKINIDIQSFAVAEKRIQELFDFEVEKYSTDRVENQKFNEILFNKVGFDYGNSSKKVLKQVSFKLESNNLYAIVGENGSGKTTLLNLLSSFYDEYEGSILIDKKDHKSINLEYLRKNIAYVQQNAYIFNLSIKENLLFGNDKSFEDVINICKKVRIHDFIEKLPLKYDTVITKDGQNISGGEKQKLAIARGLLSDSKIFLLDEVNKGLDVQTQKELAEIIEQLSREHIVLIVTHDIELLKRMKNILLLKNGEVILKGSHRQLMEESAYYKSIFSDHIVKEILI